jgi:hypothetical protein
VEIDSSGIAPGRRGICGWGLPPGLGLEAIVRRPARKPGMSGAAGDRIDESVSCRNRSPAIYGVVGFLTVLETPSATGLCSRGHRAIDATRRHARLPASMRQEKERTGRWQTGAVGVVAGPVWLSDRRNKIPR